MTGSWLLGFFSSFSPHVVKIDILLIQLFVDHRSPCLEEEELNLFIDVDCMDTEAIITPMPKGLSQQQVVGFLRTWGGLPLFPLFLLYINGLRCLALPTYWHLT